MSTTPPKYTFAVWLPDNTAPETDQSRVAARPKHLERFQVAVTEGTIKLGAVMVSPETIAEDPGNRHMNGSVILLEAESVEAVRKFLHSDPYWGANVWDKEKIDIRPVVVSPVTPLR